LFLWRENSLKVLKDIRRLKIYLKTKKKKVSLGIG
jgi:hypothetical protein